MSITIKTYQSAKKTLLQPIKTEIFKIQVESLKPILNYFYNKSEYDLLYESGLTNFIRINLQTILYEYSQLFTLPLLKEFIPPVSDEDIEGKIILAYSIQEMEDFRKYKEEYNLFIQEKGNQNNMEEINTVWLKYNQFRNLIYSKEGHKCYKKLESFANLPYLTTDLSKLIDEYLELVKENEKLIDKYIKEYSNELLNLIDNNMENVVQVLIKKYLFDCNHNRISEFSSIKLLKLKLKADEISNYIRKLWLVDELVPN